MIFPQSFSYMYISGLDTFKPDKMMFSTNYQIDLNGIFMKSVYILGLCYHRKYLNYVLNPHYLIVIVTERSGVTQYLSSDSWAGQNFGSGRATTIFSVV